MKYNIVNEYPTILAKKLKKLRAQKNLSQEDLVNEIGTEWITLRTYKSYESGSCKNPSTDKLLVIASYYEAPIDYLLTQKEYIEVGDYTLRSNLIRLTELVYSFVLMPNDFVSEDNPNDKTLVFYPPDKDVVNFLYKFKNDIEHQMFLLSKHGVKYDHSPKALVKIVDDYVKKYNYDMSPSVERLKWINNEIEENRAKRNKPIISINDNGEKAK